MIKSPALHPSTLLLALSFALPTIRAAEPLAAADVAHGQALFQQSCALCHAAGAGTAVGQGPSLVGVTGRKAASGANFNYTQPLKDSGLVWDGAALDRYLTNPTLAVPGTSMVIAVPKAEDRRDLIAYLATVKAPAGRAGAAPAVPIDPNATDPYDWRHAAPGTKRLISADKLPAPFSTPTPRNNSVVIPQPADAKLSVPPGFKIELFAKGFKNPRIVHIAPNGDIFVAETASNRISVLRAADGASEPATNEIFAAGPAAGLDRPFGMAFFPAGDAPEWIYVANNNSVVRFPYHNGDLKASGPSEIVVPKLSATSNGHSTRDIAFSKDGKRLFITVGSASNFADGAMPTKTPEEIKQWEKENALGAAWGSETRRANILVTSPDGKEPVKIFATGIRNPVGLAINPTTGDLWTSTNERDLLGDDLVPDYVTRVKEGGYYGWPWYYMGNHEDPRLAGIRPDLAGKATVPDVLLQSHSAALGVAFYTPTKGAAVFPAEYHGDLFVALHGSWNRVSRTGYKVVRAKMKAGIPTGEYEDFLTGFVASGANVWGRPVGVAVAHDGALLVTEDGNGTMWRITPTRP
jgi:glucose/arabinose dehydrogenase